MSTTASDYFSLCDFPMVASSMALPIHDNFTLFDTFQANGTLTVGPPLQKITPPAHSVAPLSTAGKAANTLLLCNGVIGHCDAGGTSTCGNKAGGHIDPNQALAVLKCIRQPNMMTGPETSRCSGGDPNTGHEQNCDSESGCKGGGWGWPYCGGVTNSDPPLATGTGDAVISDYTSQLCGFTSVPSSQRFFNCLSMRLNPIVDNRPPELMFIVIASSCAGVFGLGWLFFFISVMDPKETDQAEVRAMEPSAFVAQQEKFRDREFQAKLRRRGDVNEDDED